MLYRPLATTALAVLTLIFVACETESDSAKEPFLDDLSVPFNRATAAFEAYNVINIEFFDLDLRTVSEAEYQELRENRLEVLREANVVAREALAEVSALVPPEACDEIHTTVIEFIRLAGRGFGELISYSQDGVLGLELDEDTRLRGNEFLADAERAKQDFRILLERTPECGPSNAS